MGCALAILHCPGVLISICNAVTETEQVRPAGLTGVFPLGFGWESIGVIGWQMPRLLFASGQLAAVSRRLEPRKLFHRPIRVTREMARVLAHQGHIFPL